MQSTYNESDIPEVKFTANLFKECLLNTETFYYELYNDPNFLLKRDEEGKTILHYLAGERGNHFFIRILKFHPTQQKFMNDLFSLHDFFSPLETYNDLAHPPARISLQTKDKYGYTPLHYAVRNAKHSSIRN